MTLEDDLNLLRLNINLQKEQRLRYIQILKDIEDEIAAMEHEIFEQWKTVCRTSVILEKDSL